MKEIPVFKDTRLLEALDYIDRDLIAEVINDIKTPDMSEAYVPGKRSVLKHWRQFVAAAAVLILLSMATPAANFITRMIRDFRAAAGSIATESSELLNTEITEPLEEITDELYENTEELEITASLDTDPIYTEPVYQYVITREEFDEMNAAWKKFRGSESVNIEKKYEDVTYWYPCSGMTCIYKKEADVIVFCRHSVMCWYGEMTVAGYLFKLPYMEEIWVYNGNTFYSLNEAYSESILTEEDIKELSEIHHEHLYGENRFG